MGSSLLSRNTEIEFVLRQLDILLYNIPTTVRVTVQERYKTQTVENRCVIKLGPSAGG